MSKTPILGSVAYDIKTNLIGIDTTDAGVIVYLGIETNEHQKAD